jgi:hypothetical protein
MLIARKDLGLHYLRQRQRLQIKQELTGGMAGKKDKHIKDV